MGELNTDPIIFKCEDSLWRMLEDGSKTFEMRRYDLDDERILRLALRVQVYDGVRIVGNEPREHAISFLNKTDGHILTFEYKGMKKTEWAQGWCFLLLGKQMPSRQEAGR